MMKNIKKLLLSLFLVGTIASTAVADYYPKTGTGLEVLNNGPTLIAPILGTPASGVATNLTGTAAALNIGGTAAVATTGTTVAVSNSASYFPLFAASSSNGNQPFNLGTGLSFNPSTNALTTTTFIGALTGNASTATSTTSATNATNTAITDDTTTNAAMYLTWVTTSSGNQAQKTSSSKLTFNPSTGVLATTTFSGAGTSLTGTASSLTAGNVTTNANLTGVITSSGNATSTGAQTGTGNTFVMSVSPALTGAPTAPTQANGDNSTKLATNAYVNNAINDQVSMKDPVNAATTTALLFSPSYSNGSSGVGATLTATVVGVLVLDGYTPALNDRILVKNEASTLTQGCYKVTQLGIAITTDYILTRCTDYDQTADVLYGTTFPVLSGTANANQQFTMNNNAAITMGTTAITYAQSSGGSQLSQGAGITITGNSIAVTAPVTVALGGTNATSAGITAFNNITGYSAAGSTGTTSTNLVFSTSPTFITPVLGTPTSGTMTNVTGLPEGGLSLTDITTANSSTSQHGFLKKLDNTATHYMGGDGNWTTPAASSSLTYTTQTTTYAPTTTDKASEISFSGAGADATWTIVAGATNGSGWWAIFNNPTTHVLTVKVTTNTIDGIAGATGFPMYPQEVRLVQDDGTNYHTTILHGFQASFTSSGTFTTPPGYQYFDVECWGGGGSGSVSNAIATNMAGGGGGYNSLRLTNSQIGASQTVTIGAVAAAVSRSTTGTTIGNNGVDATFGTLVTGYAGRGGDTTASFSGAGAGGGLGGTIGQDAQASGVGGYGHVGAVAGVTAGGLAGTAGGGAGGAGLYGGGGGCGDSGASGTWAGGASVYGGGGGGCGGNTAGAGGASVYGGGGGGGGGTAAAAGGVSTYGGSGGAGCSGTACAATGGTQPGGGGGNSIWSTSGTSTSGAGAAGQCNVRGII